LSFDLKISRDDAFFTWLGLFQAVDTVTEKGSG